MLRVGTADAPWIADLTAPTVEAAMRRLVAGRITRETVHAALSGLPINDAAREVIAGCVKVRTDADQLVCRCWRSFVRYAPATTSWSIRWRLPTWLNVGSGEFLHGWWSVRTQVGEPARQWIELLAERFLVRGNTNPLVIVSSPRHAARFCRPVTRREVKRIVLSYVPLSGSLVYRFVIV